MSHWMNQLMRSEAVADLLILPLVPVTVSVFVLLLALVVVEAVNVEVTLPLPVIETDPGFSARVKPVLVPPGVSATFPVNPFAGVTVTVYVTVPPRLTVCEAGEMLTVKEGDGGVLTTRLAEVVCTKEPLVPWMVNG
jgi:hypothetical protein